MVKQQGEGLPLALLGDAAGREDRPDQQIERQHVGHVIGRLVRPEEQEPGHQGNRQQHAHLDHDPQHQRSLAEDLAAQLLVQDGVGPVGHEVDPLGRREQLVGEEVAVDHDADGVLHLLFLVDDVLALAADVGRMKQPAIDQNPRTVQVARHQGGSMAIETKSRTTTLSVRVSTTQTTARGRITR